MTSGISIELLVQHPLYKHLLKFAQSAEGREKILRLLQYLTRFLRYWKFRAILSPQFAALLPSLQASFTLCRKPLRVLKPLNHLNLFTSCINDKLSDPVLRYSEAIKQFGLFWFFTFDTIVWLKMLGLVGGRGVNESLGQSKWVVNAGKYSAMMWCLGLLGGLVKNLKQFHVLLLRRLNEDKTEITPKVRIIQPFEKVCKDFIKNVLDFVIAFNLYKNKGYNDGIIGSFGTITSILAIQDIWNLC